MSDWKEFSIGEIADPADRYSFSGGPFGSNLKSEEYTEGGVRIIQLQNIGDGHFKDNYKIYTSKEKADELLSCNIYPGEIILSKMGDPVARATLIPDSEERYLMASDGIRLKVDTARFDSVFILNAINSPQFRSSAEAVSVGSTRKRIGLTTLKGLTIYAPPLPEQKKIAEILSGIDYSIAKLDAQKTKQEKIFSSILAGIFSKLNDSHCPRRIGEICEVKRGASPRPIQSKEWWGEGRGWTRISDVTKSKKYLYTTKDRLSPEGEKRSVPINPGSIILSICATIGMPVITKIPICIHDGFVWFDGLEDDISPEFAYYFFLSIRANLLSGRQTGTQGNLNTSIVSEQLIPIPSHREQKRLSQIMSEMEFQVERINRKIQSYKNLKCSLSSDLLSGRKRVSV